MVIIFTLEFDLFVLPYHLSKAGKILKSENGIQKRILEISDKIKSAKESKSNEALPQLKQDFKTLRSEKSVVQKQIKSEKHGYSQYCRAVKPYIDAQRIIEQAESYARIEESGNDFVCP